MTSTPSLSPFPSENSCASCASKKARARKQKKKKHTVCSRRDVWIFRQHTAFLHHPPNSKGHGRIFQGYCTVHWCVPCLPYLVMGDSERSNRKFQFEPLWRGRPGLDLARLPCCTVTKKRRRCSRNHFSIVDPTLARTASSLRKEDVT